MKVYFIFSLIIGLLITISVIHGASVKATDQGFISEMDQGKSLFVVDDLTDIDIIDGLQNDSKTDIFILNENLEEFCDNFTFSSYSTAIFLLDNATILQDSQLISIQDAVESGLNVLLQTPLLWQIDNTELLGLKPLNQTVKAEWQGDIELEVLNTTYFESSSTYVGERLSFHGRGTAAINLTESTKSLLDVADIDFINEGKHLGIFEHKFGLGNIITVNVLMNKATNERFSQLFASLIQELIDFEEIANTDPNTNNINFFNISIPQEIAAVAVVGIAATVTVIGTRSVIASKKEEEIIGTISGGESDFSLIALLLAPFIWTIHVILEPKFRKLTIDEVYDNPTRKIVLEVLQHNRFEHFRELKRLSKAGVGSLTWHLQVLIDFEIINMVKFGQFKLYTLTENPPSDMDISTYFAIRNKTANKVISYFINEDYKKISLKNLTTILEVNIDTLQYHCAKLVKLKLIKLDEDGYCLNKIHKQSIIIAQEHISYNSNFHNLEY